METDLQLELELDDDDDDEYEGMPPPGESDVPDEDEPMVEEDASSPVIDCLSINHCVSF